MAKKKSKSQKARQNIKRKIKKEQIQQGLVVDGGQLKSAAQDKKRLVKKDEVIYNVAINKPNVTTKKSDNKNSLKKDNKKDTKKKNVLVKKSVVKKESKKDIKKKDSLSKKNAAKKVTKPVKKVDVKVTPKKKVELKKHIVEVPEKIIVKKTSLVNNIFSKIFSSILIVTFIVLLIGLITVGEFKTSTIIYVSAIVLFLMIIAISYNKHMSGKVFTIILCSIMIFFIYRLNYSYDFIRSLNTRKFEDKTYYIVTFDNSTNKTIYNINGKKIGLLNENKRNIERKLDTKLDNMTYVEYTDINKLYEDFYNQNFRAMVVNENEYKYLKSNEVYNNRSIKILYEFEINAPK